MPKALMSKLLAPFIALIGVYTLLTLVTNYPTQWPSIFAFLFVLLLGLRALMIYIPFRNSHYGYASGHGFLKTFGTAVSMENF